ncbi:MAG: helix-turn-helix domain-containing protein [Gammaproteobacteria bacterium]
MSFHDNLRTLRLTRGFTQPALAEKADIEQSYLSKLENGRSKPSEDVLARLASALETTSEALANGDEADPGRGKLWYALIAIASAVLLAVMFFIGRITSMYAISPQQVVAGSHSQSDLTQQIMNLAPKGVLVERISHMDPRLGDRIFVSGAAPDRAAVDAYMTAVRSTFGGEFSGIDMRQRSDNHLIQFQIDFDPQGIKLLPTTAASDRSASKH